MTTRETDGVRHARRETWQKAIAAARYAANDYPDGPPQRASTGVVAAVIHAARADGVTFDDVVSP